MASKTSTQSHILTLAQEASRAEKEGDFARARALSATLCAEAATVAAPRSVTQTQPKNSAVLRAVQDGSLRTSRLRSDPAAWQVGALALCAYIATWVYALCANR